jgi:acyl carrier protein
MPDTEALKEVEAIVRPHLKFVKEGEEIAPDRNLGEAGLDSMASIDLLLDLEEKAEIVIADDLITENSFFSLEEIAKLVEEARESS